jgi:hypothetical protein
MALYRQSSSNWRQLYVGGEKHPRWVRVFLGTSAEFGWPGASWSGKAWVVVAEDPSVHRVVFTFERVLDVWNRIIDEDAPADLELRLTEFIRAKLDEWGKNIGTKTKVKLVSCSKCRAPVGICLLHLGRQFNDALEARLCSIAVNANHRRTIVRNMVTDRFATKVREHWELVKARTASKEFCEFNAFGMCTKSSALANLRLSSNFQADDPRAIIAGLGLRVTPLERLINDTMRNSPDEVLDMLRTDGIGRDVLLMLIFLAAWLVCASAEHDGMYEKSIRPGIQLAGRLAGVLWSSDLLLCASTLGAGSPDEAAELLRERGVIAIEDEMEACCRRERPFVQGRLIIEVPAAVQDQRLDEAHRVTNKLDRICGHDPSWSSRDLVEQLRHLNEEHFNVSIVKRRSK